MRPSKTFRFSDMRWFHSRGWTLVKLESLPLEALVRQDYLELESTASMNGQIRLFGPCGLLGLDSGRSSYLTEALRDRFVNYATHLLNPDDFPLISACKVTASNSSMLSPQTWPL